MPADEKGRAPPSQAYKQFVQRCLSERGYEPVGWGENGKCSAGEFFVDRLNHLIEVKRLFKDAAGAE